MIVWKDVEESEVQKKLELRRYKDTFMDFL